jgi:hypothetical protein
MRTITYVVAATIMMAMFPSAHGAEAPPADIRCLIIGLRMGAEPDAERRSAGNLLTWYYFGRLEKMSAKSIEDATLHELAIMTPQDFNSEASRCASVLREKSHVMEEIENNLALHNKGA